jgi:SAM-dependent methyltransferase
MTYARIANHGNMLFDATRNGVYERAIRSAVGPESVVLDLGAGLGLHGLMAAGAGARRVYLVEPHPVVQIAPAVANRAGVGENIVVLQQRIEEAPLPEPVDVIVSVLTGNLLYSEDLLPSLFLARDRYLKPAGVMLPDRAQLCLAPVYAPDLHHKFVARWSEPVMQRYDYAAGRGFAANEILWLARDESTAVRQLGEAAVAADVDLRTASSGDCVASGTCFIERTDMCHGLLGWIRIRLHDEWLASAPDAPQVHWTPAMLPLDPPLPVQEGEQLAITLRRPAGGDWSWSASARAGARRHSTFLARSESPRDLARIALGAAPGLGDAGRRALDILERMSRGHTNKAIAADLVERYSLAPVRAIEEVQALARRYGASGE